jgi:V8-like Glu-specific endopeptidase
VRRNPIRLSTLIVGMLLLTIFFFGVGGESGIASPIKPAAASTEHLGGSEISVHIVSTSGTSESLLWTEDEILAAKPYPLERMPGEPAISLEAAMPDGNPVVIPGSPPKGTNQAIATNPDSITLSNAAPLGFSENPPYIRYENFDSYMEYPYSTVGVLFFKQYGVGYRCSAASIGNNAVWTAGHCIHAGDGSEAGRSKEVIFIPAYNNGAAPFGVWKAFAVLTHQEWEMNGNLSYDIGGAILEPIGAEKISEVVGNLGFSANLDNNRHWFNIGYPAAFPFDGTQQHICTASFAFNDKNMNKPYPVGIGCDMTGGASGGPWVINFSGDAGSANYLNGHNSYRYSEGPEEMFSPYFGDAAQSLRDELVSINP